ncbi:hypothetical protein GOP47_0000585 [Adiantum capillus-veneris]|uniref:Uncharacterized protein n=1 Tax=Adiantum capillus-veneris TaxID=13818 RepID=A0A9D4ZSG1_ADICA|nr:hypothetical protein GOP47_0000585 [Adiantum capillus-veneris]
MTFKLTDSHDHRGSCRVGVSHELLGIRHFKNSKAYNVCEPHHIFSDCEGWPKMGRREGLVCRHSMRPNGALARNSRAAPSLSTGKIYCYDRDEQAGTRIARLHCLTFFGTRGDSAIPHFGSYKA